MSGEALHDPMVAAADATGSSNCELTGAPGFADQRVVGEDVQGDRIFARDHAIDQRALPAPKLTIFCSLSFGDKPWSLHPARRRLVMNSGVPLALPMRHDILPFHCGSSRSS